MKMQDTSLKLKGTRVIELPVMSAFRTRASKGISEGGTFLFSAPRDTEDLLIKSKKNVWAQAFFMSWGADPGVNR